MIKTIRILPFIYFLATALVMTLPLVGSEQNARAGEEETPVYCMCKKAQTHLEREMQNEREIGMTSGFVDKNRLHSLAAAILPIQKFLKHQRSPAAGCKKIKYSDTFAEACLDAMAQGQNGADQ